MGRRDGRETQTTGETTMIYSIKFSDGRTIEATDYGTEVTGLLADIVGPDVEIGDAEQDGMQDEDGAQPMRRLVWASEDDAEGDDGARAVATVRWTE
jgi:hypothetical protein